MILPSRYYEEILYPLQDGVLNTIHRSGTDFFLTGGTALSRAYYDHRYSDDLDFFVNNNQNFDDQLDMVFFLLEEDGFIWDKEKDYTRDKNYSTFRVRKKNSDVMLKLDFVNDLVPFYGEIQKTKLFYKTDSIRNILSNKLSAIFRYAAKDIADIREIALHESINWTEIISETRTKETGLELYYIGEILTSLPQKEFDAILWKKKPGWEEFNNDIKNIVETMMKCS